MYRVPIYVNNTKTKLFVHLQYVHSQIKVVTPYETIVQSCLVNFATYVIMDKCTILFVAKTMLCLHFAHLH